MAHVSVIIPNYNHAVFLQKRIDSVLNQTYRNFEVIILDDSSSDNSKEVIEQYRHHPNVSAIVYNSKNSGSPFKQWEKGIGLAKGDWIWIAESDDWCDPNFLEVMMDGLLKNKKCVIGYCQTYCMIDENTIQWRSDADKLIKYCSGTDFIAKHLIYVCEIVNASAVVWKKELFNRVTREFTTYKSCGDWLFWFELVLKGEIMVCGRLMNYFRKHEHNVTEPALKSGLAYTEAIRMGAYLLQQGFIDAAAHKKFIQFRYEIFKRREHEVDRQKSIEINALFRSEKVTIIRWRSNRLVSKMERRFKKYYSRLNPVNIHF